MLNAPDSSDVSISEINDARVIDRGKKGGFGAGNCTQNVDLPWANKETTQNPHHMMKCETFGNSKMDLFYWGGNLVCFSHLTYFASTYLEHGKKTSQDYDILILALGTWELKRPWDCRKQQNETDSGKRLQMALKSLSALATPKFRIIWRTIGYTPKESSKAPINIYNQIAKEYIDTQPYMSYVDWGGEIERRSFGSSRIKGDMDPHYGLEARTLMANMLTHELASLKSRN
jgi:hypothetical protein